MVWLLAAGYEDVGHSLAGLEESRLHICKKFFALRKRILTISSHKSGPFAVNFLSERSTVTAASYSEEVIPEIKRSRTTSRMWASPVLSCCMAVVAHTRHIIGRETCAKEGICSRSPILYARPCSPWLRLFMRIKSRACRHPLRSGAVPQCVRYGRAYGASLNRRSDKFWGCGLAGSHRCTEWRREYFCRWRLKPIRKNIDWLVHFCIHRCFPLSQLFTCSNSSACSYTVLFASEREVSILHSGVVLHISAFFFIWMENRRLVNLRPSI